MRAGEIVKNPKRSDKQQCNLIENKPVNKKVKVNSSNTRKTNFLVSKCLGAIDNISFRQ